MAWYESGKKVEALRKHVLRVDLHVHCGEIGDFNNPNDLLSTIRSTVSAAIVKGLDVVGIVSHNGPEVGQMAQQSIIETGADLFVIPGQEYCCVDKARFIAYNVAQKIPENMACDQAIAYVHENKGFVMAIEVSKRFLQHYEKIQGTVSAPDAIEIYNASSGGYRDITTEYHKFVSSAAKNSREMDDLNVYTLIDRAELEEMGVLPQGYGENYVPQYLQKSQNQNVPVENNVVAPEATV